MNGQISVAVDGPSGAGKSTLARACAKAFNFIYVDTGAIYRTVGLAAYRAGIDCHDAVNIEKLLPSLDIQMAYNAHGEQCMILNGEDVSKEIRLPEISICASDVSSLPLVRAFLMEMQRKMACENNVIMDGRDIGTVVLPDAEIKIFLTASSRARAQRRLAELSAKGVETNLEDVLKDIEYRDYQDSHREAAPLRRAEDAILMDTSELTLEQSIQLMISIIKERSGLRAAEE